MLENSKKIFLLSHDPSDASFLAEFALTQQAAPELAIDMPDLCAKIAAASDLRSITAIFVDVTTPAALRNFEFEIQRRLGNSVALELAHRIHFLSGQALETHREMLLSPYFSFFSERKTSDFRNSVERYRKALHPSSTFFTVETASFDQNTRLQFQERTKKVLRSKNYSVEWTQKFTRLVDELIEEFFPARFEFSGEMLDTVLSMGFRSRSHLPKTPLKVENFLKLGVSLILSADSIVLFAPVIEELSDVNDAFRFLKVER